MLDLNYIRQEFAEHMAENAAQRFSFDAALFHVAKIVYQQGYQDGISNNKKEKR